MILYNKLVSLEGVAWTRRHKVNFLNSPLGGQWSLVHQVRWEVGETKVISLFSIGRKEHSRKIIPQVSSNIMKVFVSRYINQKSVFFLNPQISRYESLLSRSAVY